MLKRRKYRKNSLTDEQKKLIVNADTCKEAVRLTGASPSYCWKLRFEHNRKRTYVCYKKYSEKEIEWLIEQYFLNERPLKEIAADLGRSRFSVTKKLTDLKKRGLI